jgi:hypothetical protein
LTNTNIIPLPDASKKKTRRPIRPTYPAGWAYNAEAIAELTRIKAQIADPLLEARSFYCRQLADMEFDEVVGELQTVIAVVREIKFGERDEIRSAA